MEPKYFAKEVIGHPNHPLTRKCPRDFSKQKIYRFWRCLFGVKDLLNTLRLQSKDVVHHDATTPTIHTAKVTKTFSMNP